MHFCGFRLFGEGGQRIQISSWATKEFKMPEAQKDSTAPDEEPIPEEMKKMIAVEKEVKPEERCGLAYLRGIVFSWGKNLDACNPFKNGDSFRDRFPGTCFHTGGGIPADGP